MDDPEIEALRAKLSALKTEHRDLDDVIQRGDAAIHSVTPRSTASTIDSPDRQRPTDSSAPR